MSRRFWITSHLYLAAFFAPLLLLVAVSGGLYLTGYKGEVHSTEIATLADTTLDLETSSLHPQVEALLRKAGVEHNFEYVKRSGNTLLTRPTSRLYYSLNVTSDSVTLARHQPNLQKRLIELHKGHGPLLFKRLQQLLALGLVLVVLSGFWLGVTSSTLRNRSLLISGLGVVVFVVLAFVL